MTATTPYTLGRQHAAARITAIETYNARPAGDPCPYPKGTPAEADYDRGWKDYMREEREHAGI